MFLDFNMLSDGMLEFVVEKISEDSDIFLKVKNQNKVHVIDTLFIKQNDASTSIQFLNVLDYISEIYISKNTDQAISVNDSLLADGLFAFSDEEYDLIFRNRTSRPDNLKLNYFVARQLSSHFPGSAYGRVGGAIVTAYKAIEIGDMDFVDESNERINSTYVLLDSFKQHSNPNNSPRVSAEHLLFSLLCAQWHLKIMQEDMPGLLDALIRVRKSISIPRSLFSKSFPINLSLLLYALISKIKKDENHFNTLLDEMYFVYKKGVANSTIRIRVHFYELSVPHSCVVHALELRDSYKNVCESKRLIKKVFFRAVRVEGDAAEMLYKKFLGLICAR